MVNLSKITRSNWVACAQLKLASEQEGLLAPNVYSIAEWHFEPHYTPRAIYADDRLVGFLMYCVETDPPDPLLYWLFRFMIDREHQGQGFGKAALRLAIDEMTQAGANRIRTMHRPRNTVASRLYRSAGFVEVGTLDDGDTALELRVETTAEPPSVVKKADQ